MMGRHYQAPSWMMANVADCHCNVAGLQYRTLDAQGGVSEQQFRILEALGALVSAHPDDVRAALDALEDDHHNVDPYARDRTMIAVSLLQAADDDVAFLAESLALACPPERRDITTFRHRQERR